MTDKLDWRPAYQALRSGGWSDSEIAEVAGVTRAVVNGVINGTYSNQHSVEFAHGFFLIRVLVLLERQNEIEPFDFSQIGYQALALSKLMKAHRRLILGESQYGGDVEKEEKTVAETERAEEARPQESEVIAFESDILTKEEFRTFKSVMEGGIALAKTLGRMDKVKKLTEMLEDMEVRVNRLYPEQSKQQ